MSRTFVQKKDNFYNSTRLFSELTLPRHRGRIIKNAGMVELVDSLDLRVVTTGKTLRRYFNEAVDFRND